MFVFYFFFLKKSNQIKQIVGERERKRDREDLLDFDYLLEILSGIESYSGWYEFTLEQLISISLLDSKLDSFTFFFAVNVGV